MAKASGVKGRYQRVMPITDKNVGKNYLKSNGPTRDKGSGAAARRLRQLARQAAKAGRQSHE